MHAWPSHDHQQDAHLRIPVNMDFPMKFQHACQTLFLGICGQLGAAFTAPVIVSGGVMGICCGCGGAESAAEH